MTDVHWKYYPFVASDQMAQAWLQIQANLQLRPKTIDAYGRCLNDYLAFCSAHQVKPETITREQLTLYVQDLVTRPHPKGATILLHVSDGFAALKMVRTLISQLILLDYLLPDMDGLECLDRL